MKIRIHWDGSSFSLTDDKGVAIEATFTQIAHHNASLLSEHDVLEIEFDELLVDPKHSKIEQTLKEYIQEITGKDSSLLGPAQPHLTGPKPPWSIDQTLLYDQGDKIYTGGLMTTDSSKFPEIEWKLYNASGSGAVYPATTEETVEKDLAYLLETQWGPISQNKMGDIASLFQEALDKAILFGEAPITDTPEKSSSESPTEWWDVIK